MTMAEKKDGEQASYLDIAEAIRLYCYDPAADLRALWQRMVFNILVSNCDDHLRNHGFLFHPGRGWALSPAYDMNPDPDKRTLHTNINEIENELNLDLAMSVAGYFRISNDEAARTVQHFSSVVRQWENVAGKKAFGLSVREIKRMAPAFRLA